MILGTPSTRALLAAALAFVATLSAQAGITSERLLANVLKNTPDAVLVKDGEQMKEADAAVKLIPGAESFWGVGNSMAPLFASRTALVVVPMRFSQLKAGMTVVYVNSCGRMVAHVLTGDLPKGWIAQGIANDREDDDLVTADNLLGVVVQAFSAVRTEYRVELTRTLIAKGRLGATYARN